MNNRGSTWLVLSRIGGGAKLLAAACLGLSLLLASMPSDARLKQSTSTRPSTPAGGVCTHSPLVITRATLWTAKGLIENAEVVTADGRVVATGKSGKVARPPGAQVIDARGDTLLPGLIDAHAHLVFPGGAPKEFLAQAHLITAKQLLRSGVTSARIHLWDLEDGPPFRREAEGDCFPSPRLQIGGPGFIGGAPELNGRNVWGIKDAEDARRKIGQVKSAGAEWIAIHNLTKFAPGQIEELVAEARRAGLRVMAAGERPANIQRALEVGVDSIEYIDLSTSNSYSPELITRMREQRARLFLVPPIGYFHRFMEYRRNAGLLDDPLQTEFMPTGLSAYLLNDLRAQRDKPSQSPDVEQAFASLPAKFRQLYDAGLNVVVGSDCGSPANFQADSIWWELEAWRRLGVEPVEVVRAATARSAALLQSPDVGHLNVGARADFVIYKGSINRGSFNAGRVRYVAKGGVLFVQDGRWVGP